MTNNHKPLAISHKQITIGWLYPDLMSTYGDRGNIAVLEKRSKWRGIETTILPISQETKPQELQTIDILFGGGAQDKAQELVMSDLKKGKNEAILEIIEANCPAIFVCGAPQLMGKHYEPAEGERIEGIGVFDIETKHPGPRDDRLIGNIVAEVLWENIENNTNFSRKPTTIVGFENHGGRTRLGPNAKPFAKVIKGHGNNGEDGTEGVVHKNAIGCYFHGPLLPKNPEIADWLIKKALERKYDKEIMLSELDDTLAITARKVIADRLGVSI